MQPGPALASEILPSILAIDAAPRDVGVLVEQVILQEGWAASPADAQELAERWRVRILVRLRTQLSELNVLGRFCIFDFNSSSNEMIQGACFVEPGVDAPEVVAAKRARSRMGHYAAALAALAPTGFEALCRGVLSLLGVNAPALTPSTSDEGIDFYGRVNVGGYLMPRLIMPGVSLMLNVWLVGQAKHYVSGQVATPLVRELVGAVRLAQAGAFSRVTSAYPDLQIRLCDPVFYLFFTTGTISTPSWRLLQASGVVGLDGEMLAAFLADHEVGVDAQGQLDTALLSGWVASFT